MIAGGAGVLVTGNAAVLALAVGAHRLDASHQVRAATLSYQYDALNRPTRTTYPDGTYEATTYARLDVVQQRDRLGRVTTETRADATTTTSYTYEPLSGRLATVTDPKAQVTTYTYALDDALASLTFTNAAIATPGVSSAYDRTYPRIQTMTDGTGVTAYTYHPTGQPAQVRSPVSTVRCRTTPSPNVTLPPQAIGRDRWLLPIH